MLVEKQNMRCAELQFETGKENEREQKQQQQQQ